jgi:hypothetical protein
MICLWGPYTRYLNPISFLRYTLILSLHLYVYFPNRLASVLHFTSPHACYMCLLISCQFSSYSFLRRLRPRPLYPQLLLSRRLVGSRPDLDSLKRKYTAPFLTSNHGPSLYRLSYPDSTIPLLVKIFSSLRLSETSVNTSQTLTTQKLSLHCVHVLVHIPQTLRHRHAEHFSQSVACACSPHSRRNLYSHTHFAPLFCSAWVQCSSGETTGKQHLAATLSRLGLPTGGREKQK